MKVIHSCGNFEIEKNVKEEPSFILTNKIGGYCCLSNKPSSRYQGVFFNDNFRMYTVIENINLADEFSVSELRNYISYFERKRGSIIERFFMPYRYNSFVYSLNDEKEVEIVLDVRESYKIPKFGRFYEIFEEDGKIIISYKQEGEPGCYLIINGHNSYITTKKWFKREYELDKKRNSLPYEMYVFSAVKIKSKQLVFSFSFDKGKAIQENDYIIKNLNKLAIKQNGDIQKIFGKCFRIKGKDVRMAYLCALNSLNNLVVSVNNTDGIYAGLPWFFQFWARDEAVSLKALKNLGENEVVNKIAARLVDNIREDGSVLNKYPNGNFYSADSAGWILERCYNLDRKLLKQKKFNNLFIDKNKDSLILNGSNETWMDSINREGVRIEVQALFLNIYKLLFKITGNERYKELEERLKERVRKEFWNGRLLADGLGDNTIRPNLFIAAYIYPKLLSKEEWSICFSNALDKLWLSWGGLSTVDKNNDLFCSNHTGENPKSYHNGDSWFYLNNLAALVLYRTNKKEFNKYINKILEASANEILWKGAVGNHAELSSAVALSSEGCFAQAWSAAMFIELVDELMLQK